MLGPAFSVMSCIFASYLMIAYFRRRTHRNFGLVIWSAIAFVCMWIGTFLYTVDTALNLDLSLWWYLLFLIIFTVSIVFVRKIQQKETTA